MGAGGDVGRHNFKRLPPSDGGAVYLSCSCPADIYPSARYLALARIVRAIDSKIVNSCLMGMRGHFRGCKGVIFSASSTSQIRGGSDRLPSPNVGTAGNIGAADIKGLRSSTLGGRIMRATRCG